MEGQPYVLFKPAQEDNEDLLGSGAQNIMTLDGEIMALNGRVLTGQMADATSERDIVRALADDRASVCSCTCYGRSTARSRAGDDERNGSGGETNKEYLPRGVWQTFNI